MKDEALIKRMVAAIVTDEADIVGQIPPEAPPKVQEAFKKIIPRLHEDTKVIVDTLVRTEISDEDALKALNLLENKSIVDVLEKVSGIRAKAFEEIKPKMERAILAVVLEEIVTAKGPKPESPLNPN